MGLITTPVLKVGDTLEGDRRTGLWCVSVLSRLFVCVAVSGALCAPLQAQAIVDIPVPPAADEGFVTVRFEAGMSLRSLAAQHLDDPDLWPIILRLNGIDDIATIALGQELKIPGSQVELAASALEASLGQIQKANEAGAQLFAPILIRNAIEFRDQAVLENRDGVYHESIALSSKSINRAEAARTTSEQRRDVEAEARLSDRQGWVEGQKTSENSWSERELNAILNEQEKLRTLSSSTAQVVFRDASRLRLNANSQAVIQRMRVDPLKRREEAQISLVEGDFYALLATESNRNRLEVNLPNVEAKIDSGSFWVSQDESGAKFSNYDVKPVAIIAGEETLVLGRNEGAVVGTGQRPDRKIAVIGRVTLDQPQDGDILFTGNVRLSWLAIDASAYWLELAHDPRFDRMADSRNGISGTSLDDLDLPPGIYFWRVAALDGFGLRGPMSIARKFEVRTDDLPPFLRIRTPQGGAVLREAQVTISGETEAGAAVFVGDAAADVDRDGRYFFTVTAEEGANEISVTARDVAGNETVRTVAFAYMADARGEIAYDESLPRDESGRFLTATDQLTLSGTAAGQARITVRDIAGTLRSETYSDAEGRFALNVPLLSPDEELALGVTTASGYEYEEAITAGIRDRPPVIALDRPVPAVTAEPVLNLAIAAEAGTRYSVNGKPGTRDAAGIGFTIELAEGPNQIEIVATNPVGLVSIEKRRVILDSLKPEMTANEIAVEQRGTGQVVTMRIEARDGTGLAKTARVRLSGPSGAREGVLRYNRARKSYLGSVELPSGESEGDVKLEVELADVAGNTNSLEFSL